MVIHSSLYSDRPAWYKLMVGFKQPLEKAIILVSLALPEPVKEKTSNPNTQRLIDTWDWLLENDSNPSKRKLWQSLKKITCIIYDSENYYSLRWNAFLKKLIDRGWEFELPPEKASWWKEEKR